MRKNGISQHPNGGDVRCIGFRYGPRRGIVRGLRVGEGAAGCSVRLVRFIVGPRPGIVSGGGI